MSSRARPARRGGTGGGTAQASASTAWKRASWPIGVVAVLLALALLAQGCGSERLSRAEAGIPSALLAQERPIGVGDAFHPAARGAVLGGCLSRLGVRDGVHVEVFAFGRVVLLPVGIGTLAPRIDLDRISHARCYGPLVTLDPTGLVLVRRDVRLHVSDLFGAWGQPLSTHRLGSFAGRVAVFVDGRRWRRSPGAPPLRRHAEIVLEIGAHVPPHRFYSFPPGT